MCSLQNVFSTPPLINVFFTQVSLQIRKQSTARMCSLRNVFSTPPLINVIFTQDVSDVARARSEFFHGRRDILVITERFHFYHRFKLRYVSSNPKP